MKIKNIIFILSIIIINNAIAGEFEDFMRDRKLYLSPQSAIHYYNSGNTLLCERGNRLLNIASHPNTSAIAGLLYVKDVHFGGMSSLLNCKINFTLKDVNPVTFYDSYSFGYDLTNTSDFVQKNICSEYRVSEYIKSCMFGLQQQKTHKAKMTEKEFSKFTKIFEIVGLKR